jgi:ribosomal-protein-alanine N-acetyltransferase
MINPYSIGKNIYLRAPTEEDVKGNWYQWLSDPEITSFLGERWWPNTIDGQLDFFNSLKNNKERLVLAVCDINTDKHIGICNLSSISWVHRHADVALIIGDKDYRNGIYAMETFSLLLQVAFDRLNMYNLRSAYISTNPHTPLFERFFGFIEIGRFTDFMFHNGSYVDLIMTQLKRENWTKRNVNIGEMNNK